MDQQAPLAAPSTASYAARKKRCLVFLLVLAFMGGVIIVGVPTPFSGIAVNFVVPIGWLVTALFWCHYDALERGFPISRSLNSCMFLLFVVGFPYYVFRTRGWAGFRTLGFALVFLCLMVASSLLGAGCTFLIGVLLFPHSFDDL